MKKKLLAVVLGLTMVFASTVAVSAYTWGDGGNNIDTMNQWKQAGTLDAGNEAATEAVANWLANEVVQGKYKIIDTATMQKWILGSQNKKMVVVDTMPEGDTWFNLRHIDAAHIVSAYAPLNNGEKWTKAAKKNIVNRVQAEAKKISKKNWKKVPVVTYCGFVKCGRSHTGAAVLKKAGFKNVYRYTGGISAWVDGYVKDGADKYPTAGTQILK